MGRINHLRLGGASGTCKLLKQSFPNPALCPADEPVIDGGRWTIFGRTIAPAAAAFQHVQYAADHAPVINAALPRTSVGKNGSIFAHCSSDSQNRLHRMVLSRIPGKGITVPLKNQQNHWVLTLVAMFMVWTFCHHRVTENTPKRLTKCCENHQSKVDRNVLRGL